MLNLQKNCKGHKEKTLIITDPTRFSEPLLLKEAEPGDVLEVKLLGLSASAVALCYASVSAPERNGHHLPLTSQGGCLLPSPLYPGNQLYLPVYLPGGGLSLGRPLGAFNGEPLQIQAEIRILEDFPLQRPRLENPFALAFLASATSARVACRLALGDLLAFVQRQLYCSREQAFQLIRLLIHPVYYRVPNSPAVTVSLSLPHRWAK